MLLKILKIILISSVIILFMHHANRMLNDSDTIYPEKVKYYHPETNSWEMSLPSDPGMGQLKASFNFKNDVYPNKRKEILIEFLGSFELYWEGVLIGRNGRISEARDQELQGHLDQKYIIPDSLLRPEINELLLIYSDHFNTERANITAITVEPYNEFYKRTIAQSILIYALAGIFLIVTIYYVFLYFNTFRKTSYLLFALLCGFSFALIVYAYSRNYYPYTYDQYQVRQVVIWILSSIISLHLPFFYLYYFDHPKKKLFNIAIPSVFIISAMISWPLGTLFTMMAILLPLYFVVWALVKNKQGGAEAMIGLIVFLSSFMYFNISVYVGFGVLVIITLLSLSISLGKERKAHEQSLLRSSRLESQLLKRNIQPHFLMNTLTNIISLIESNPKMSIQLIQALSDEFYALMEIADKRLIPIEKEVELCKSHLEIMSIRNDISYKLEATLNESIQIPPAVLHTLVENGITHNEPINGMVTFKLNVSKNGKAHYIALETHGKAKNHENMIEDGTGLKYVKARLEESFPGKWEMVNEETKLGWRTEIKMNYENSNSRR